MRKTRIAQASIFESYSKHDFGVRLKALSDLLDQHPDVLTLVAKDLVDESVAKVGRTGLSVESFSIYLLVYYSMDIKVYHFSRFITGLSVSSTSPAIASSAFSSAKCSTFSQVITTRESSFLQRRSHAA